MKLKDRVLLEIENIKKYATPEQLDRLNLDSFNPNSPERCIYGLMCGSCFNLDALKLMQKCTTPYSKKIFIYVKSKTKHFLISAKQFPTDRDFTALEYYIVNYPKDNINIIKYLKGEIETLMLKSKKK